ncbi:MAG: preprotein translocase subunit SecG [Methylococcaceae bacterium]|nr:preprotein translocase subunit SecG [Methylococcaceae bacterium]
MYQVLIVIHVLMALSIIGLVLLQQGRGADAGAGFGGGGASNTVFGARGAASFLSRTTAILAALFFSTSIVLAYLGSKHDNKGTDILESPATEQVPSDLPQGVTQPAPASADLPEGIGAGQPVEGKK